MDKIIKKIKDQFDKIENKKLMNNLLIILLLSIMLLLGTSILRDSNKKTEAPVLKENTIEYNNKIELDYSTLLEEKLENILSKIKGVGKVSVMITLEDSSEKIPASNVTRTKENTNETDSEGGTREIEREDESIQLVTISTEVFILKEIKPTVKGVIVVAEDVEDGATLESLYEAVKTVLGIPGNKVQVFYSK